MYFDFFYNFAQNISNSKKNFCKIPVVFVRLYKNLGFLNIFSKNNKINSVKIPSVGDEFFDMDGQREIQLDVTELIVALCNAANAPKPG